MKAIISRMLHMKKLASIYLLAAGFASILANPWAPLAVRDELTVYMKQIELGALYHQTLIDEKRKIITDSICLMVKPGNKIQGISEMEIQEVRRYDWNGDLIDARQSLAGEIGSSEWKLRKHEGAWEHLTITAGSASKQPVDEVTENLKTAREFMQDIKSGNITVGKIWTDTKFELMSSKPITIVTTCTKVLKGLVPHYHFVNKDNLTKMAEVMHIDGAGRTILQQVPPYFVAKASKDVDTMPAAPGRPSIHFSDLTKIPAQRAAKKNERIKLLYAGDFSLHESVVEWYDTGQEEAVLKPLISVCQSGNVSADLKKFTTATPIMQTGDDKIKKLAAKIAGSETDRCAIVHAMNHYVDKHIRNRDVATFSSALETLKAGYGDCGEHAVLLGALLRAVNIPARIVYGLVYISSRNGYFYHAWTMAYTGEWIFADPSHGKFPAPRNRIPLIIDDSGQNLIYLASMLDKVKIKYTAGE
ncbi:MAG: hypothetical protein GF398_13050 [Chitinivibrionales bacterium]|nr:hypothetical protein [Chitinivibrionales bacterium]